MPDADEIPRTTPRSLLRVVLLFGGLPVLYFAALIGMTGGFPRPVRILCAILVIAPILFVILLVILSLYLSARGEYLEIKAVKDPKARLKKIAGLILTSLFLTALGAFQFFGRLESDKFRERQRQDATKQMHARHAPTTSLSSAPTTSPTPPLQTTSPPLPPATSPGEAAQRLHDAIYNSPVIIPKGPAPAVK